MIVGGLYRVQMDGAKIIVLTEAYTGFFPEAFHAKGQGIGEAILDKLANVREIAFRLAGIFGQPAQHEGRQGGESPALLLGKVE